MEATTTCVETGYFNGERESMKGTYMETESFFKQKAVPRNVYIYVQKSARNLPPSHSTS